MNRLQITFIGILILLALGLAILAGRSGRQDSPVAESAPETQSGPEIEAARKALADPNATEAEVYISLVRLALKNDPLARTEAIARASNPHAKVREGAAEALGYFEDDEAVKTLGRLLEDREPAVRAKALQSAGYRVGTNREEILKHFLSDTKRSESEKLAAFASMVRSGQNPSIRGASIDEIVKVAKAGAGSIRLQALRTATQVAPDHPDVVSLLKRVVSDGGNDEATALGVRHLAAMRDEWFLKQVPSVAKKSAPAVRVALADSIHLICPKERWAILSDMAASSKDKTLLHAVIGAVQRLGESEGKIVLAKISKNQELDEESVKALSAAMKGSESSPKPCSK